MNHQFKPGDLALITAAANFGRVAMIIYGHMGPDRIELPSGRFQLIPEGVMSWQIEAEGLVGTMLNGRQVIVGCMAYSSKWLIPLRGDFTPEQQKANEVEPC